jgi:hypothetical protein
MPPFVFVGFWRYIHYFEYGATLTSVRTVDAHGRVRGVGAIMDLDPSFRLLLVSC